MLASVLTLLHIPKELALSFDDDEETLFYQAEGKKLAQMRRQAGLSQEDIAEIAGVDQRTISNYENGRTPCSILVYAVYIQAERLAITQSILEIGANKAKKGMRLPLTFISSVRRAVLKLGIKG